jgi:Small, acid-soluble spore proteins, alpha/beta type
MPRRGGRHQVLVKGAEQAMEAFKLEIAQDLGLAELIDADGSYKNFTTVQVGQIGGEMVRRIQAAGEQAIMERFKSGQGRLMPDEVLPARSAVRSVTNNGNPTVHETHDPQFAPNSGQQFSPMNTNRLQ